MSSPCKPIEAAEYKALLPYIDGREKEAVELLLTHGTSRKAAANTQWSKSSLLRALKRARKIAAYQGHAPGTAHHHKLPEGYHIKGVSELVDAAGMTKLRWVKSEMDKKALEEQLDHFIEEIQARVTTRVDPVPCPDVSQDAKNMAIVIPMGDPHVGMYAWAKEAEADFDCKTAEKLLVNAVTNLVNRAPEAERLYLINLGDFFHSDVVTNRTLASGNPLDVDGRWAKVQEIGWWIMVTCINQALKKFPEVIVHNAIGNHDEHTSQALAAVLSAWYRDEPRVTIVREYSKFWYTQWGECMIGVHHGHTTKFNQIPIAMAAHQPKMWGNTKFRYYYMGHLHHSEKKEFPGIVVEQFRTLAPKDAWHWGNANYISMRDMQAIHLHRRYGEVGRHTCPVEYLETQNDPEEN